MTNAPRRGSRRTRPSWANRVSASRTGIRLTPNFSARAGSSRWRPGRSSPRMIARRSAATIDSHRACRGASPGSKLSIAVSPGCCWEDYRGHDASCQLLTVYKRRASPVRLAPRRFLDIVDLETLEARPSEEGGMADAIPSQALTGGLPAYDLTARKAHQWAMLALLAVGFLVGEPTSVVLVALAGAIMLLG